ncbi:MAG TPA: biotin/lipoyl-containing protein [Kineosporiaceae bacterium]|nr:biotin/lipoyl-containing protein [Kineosporiaceae bacterium]
MNEAEHGNGARTGTANGGAAAQVVDRSRWGHGWTHEPTGTYPQGIAAHRGDLPDPDTIAAYTDSVRRLVQLLTGGTAQRIVLTLGGLTLEVDGRQAPTPAGPVHVEPVSGPLPHAGASGQATTPDGSGGGASSAAVPDGAGPACATVAAPLIGVFYRAPAPGQSPFVAVGDRVDAGRQVAIVEAMKTMNEVVAPLSGTVTQVLAGDGEVVEFGQPLFTIRPS